MAEFALGLTKTAVEGTLSLVKSAAEEEKQLREKVQNDLVFISDEFEMMRSFLRVANNKKKNDDQVVLTLVRQLRTLAFDVEDCVENVVHLDLDKSSRWGWLQRLWQMVNCCAQPLPLDMAVAEIKQLKDRVEDVCHRNTRYNSLILRGSDDYSNSNNKKQPAATVVMTPAEQPPNANTTTYLSSASAFHKLRDAWEATGNWCNNMCNLQQELLISRDGEDDHDLQVISVWGSSTSTAAGGGGGGGADLVTASVFRKAYRDPKICEKFKIRAWVKLTHPFNQDEFVKSLLAQFSVSSSHQANTGVDFSWMTRTKAGEVMDADNLMKAKLMEHRFLVVLEDVFTLEEWDVIKMYMPDRKNGSRIVLSTPQLGIALMCTGETYQVSELRKFPGDKQFLCAFFKNKMRRDRGEFYRQLRHQGVISVWGPDGDDKSDLVDKLHKGLINGWFKDYELVSNADEKADHVGMLRKGIRDRIRKFDKVVIGQHRQIDMEFKGGHGWVDVPDPFDKMVFAQRLFLNFCSDDIRAEEIRKVGMEGEAGLMNWSHEFLFGKEDYLMIINGLQSKDDWDLIQSNFFSSKATTPKGCILVITNEETMATHCGKDHKYQAFNVKDLKADTSIATLINKGSWLYGIRGMKGRLFKNRRKDALEWIDKFKNVGSNNPYEEKKDEVGFGVYTVSEESIMGIQAKAILRHVYYAAFQQIEHRSWVDMPRNSFDLMDFSWRLLLDFYSDDPQAKEATAVGLMEGTIIDPIEKCREFLRNGKCLVVINGLWHKEDWDSIKDTFLSDDSEHVDQKNIIIVSSLDRRINTYCSPKVLRLGNQQGFTDTFYKEYDRIFYTERCQKALEWTEKFKPVGRETEVGLLTHRVRRYGVVWTWAGIPGTGKSSLVRTVYRNEMLRSAQTTRSPFRRPYFQAFGWVDVRSPFNLTEFACHLLLDLYSDDPQAMQTAMVSMIEQGQVPILDCCNILQNIKCLVVIDGLCSMQDWDLIKATILSEPIKSTIVVVTNQEVPMHCVENNEDRVVNIRRLEAGTALNLLEKIAWEDKELTSEEMEQSNSIVAKCGGLPKVITAIGEACRSNRWDWLYHLSRNFMGPRETDPEFHGLRPLFSWMQSYFDACSDSLKPCIFYLTIFSAEKNIRLRRLLWRWIAEGYCRDTSDGRTCVENGEKFISELTKLSIIQESASSDEFCQINGFFHEYIISRPMEDNLVFALEKGCSLNSTRAGHHLTIRSTWDRTDRIVYESMDFSRLRSLTVFGKWESFFIYSKKVNMRLLRVLDLEDATDVVTNEDLEQIARQLTRLKFLSLRGHTKINCLPSLMGCLRQLQTLDIRHTSIVALPLFITKLEKLRYLRAGTTEAWDRAPSSAAQAVTNLPKTAATPTEGARDSTASSSAQAVTNIPVAAATIEATSTEGGTDSTAPVLPPDVGNNRPHTPTLVSSLLSKLCRRNNGPAAGVTVPADIGKLSVLHTLGVVKVSAQCGKAIFQELKKLTQLRRLAVSGINKGNVKEFCEAISGHAHLKSLSVELNDGKLDDGNKDESDDIPQLALIRKLPNLEKLKLDMTIAKPEEFRNHEDARKHFMSHLRIRPIQNGELTICPCWVFVRVVEIQCSSKLHINFVNENNESFYFKVLKVHFSRGSQSSLQISGLSKLRYLKEVWLNGYTEAHKQYMQRQIEGHQQRPVLKLVRPRSS